MRIFLSTTTLLLSFLFALIQALPTGAGGFEGGGPAVGGLRIFLSTTTLLLGFLLAPTQALPTGAGGCAGGGPAVGGLHLSADNIMIYNFNNAYTVTVAEANFPDQTFTLDPENVVSGGETGIKYLMTITPNPDYQDDDSEGLAFDPVVDFRGFLFRVSNADNPSQDTTSYVEVVDPSYSSVAAQCTAINIGGITHINNDLKSVAQAYVTFPTPGNYIIDVTNVVKNRLENTVNAGNVQVSQYGHSSYQVEILNAPTTSAPVPGPAPTAGAPAPAPTARGPAPTASAPAPTASAPTAMSGPTPGTSAAGLGAVVSSALMLVIGGGMLLVV